MLISVEINFRIFEKNLLGTLRASGGGGWGRGGGTVLRPVAPAEIYSRIKVETDIYFFHVSYNRRIIADIIVASLAMTYTFRGRERGEGIRLRKTAMVGTVCEKIESNDRSCVHSRSYYLPWIG